MSSLARILLLLVFVLSLPALAKPMPSPTLEEGVKASPIIVVARYKSYRNEDISYFGGAKATYTITRTLKGETPANALLTIAYAFQDGSACLEPKGWTFRPSTMPEVGSQWILLLQLPGTYRGDFGRLPATEENLKRVKALIAAQ